MKLVNVKIVSLLVISYSIALVAMTPLSWILPFAEPRLQPMGIRLVGPQGSIWDGQAVLLEKNLGQVSVHWNVKLASLLLLKLPVEVQLSNANLSMSGLVTAGVGGLSVSQWSGYADEKAFESVYRRYKAQINGRLQLDNVSGAMSWGHKLKEASGHASWSGGEVTIPVGRSQQSYDVPMMLGTVSSDENAWHFVANSSDGQAYIEADLSREGEGTVAVKSALAQTMGIPVPDIGENVVKLSQQVF